MDCGGHTQTIAVLNATSPLKTGCCKLEGDNLGMKDTFSHKSVAGNLLGQGKAFLYSPLISLISLQISETPRRSRGAAG